MELRTKFERKLNAFAQLGRDELECLAAMQSRPRLFRRGQQLTEEGQRGRQAFVLQDGWACSHKDLPNGTRQIISFPVAGDIVGLRSTLLKTAEHSFSTLTEATISVVNSEHLRRCIEEFPRLGAALMWSASRDEAMIVEHLVSIGRRTAVERTAHFFLELAERFHLIGDANDAEFACPLSQTVLGDALGLTAIHVNRVLRQLREQGYMTMRDGRVKIHDLKQMKDISGFQGRYLDEYDSTSTSKKD